MKLVWKFTLPQLCIVVCLGLMGLVVINRAFVTMRARYIADIVDGRFERIYKDIAARARDSVIQASFVVTLPEVMRAYDLALSGDIDDPYSPQVQAARELLRKEFARMLEKHTETTGSVPPLHFHLPNGRSLARLWRDKQTKVNGEWVDVSDDLSSYRSTVMDVNRNGKTAMGLEVGSGGFAIRGVIPVNTPDGRQIGSAEVLQDFDEMVVAASDAGEITVAVYANKELCDISPALQDRATYPFKGDFVRVSRLHDPAIEALITPELLSGGKRGDIFEEHDNVVFAARPLADYSGKQVGVTVCVMHTWAISNFMYAAEMTLILMLTGMIIAPSALFLLRGRSLVTNPLNMIRAKIQDIAEDRANLSERIPISQRDEIGELAGWFNVLTAKLVVILEELRASDERMRSILDTMPLSAMLWERDVSLIYCNQATVGLFALPDKQTVLDRFFELAPEYQPCGRPSREMVLEYIAKTFAEGRSRSEWVHQDAHGKPIPCMVTLVRVRLRERDIVAAYVQDLRNRHAMLDELRRESARFEEMAYWYESLLDSIPFPVSVQDVEAKWRFVNKALEKLLGRKREDLVGLPCSDWGIGICNTDQCAIACAKRGCMQTYFVQGGSSYQVDVAILKNLHDEPTGFIEVIQDITKLEQVTKERTDAEAASQAKSAFLARMSHEIRTPMNAILGITEMQMHDATLSHERKEAFYKIYAAGYTLLGIINDLLDLSKIEAGKMELLPGNYEIASLINDAVQLNLLRIGSKQLEFKLKVDEDMPTELVGDNLRIRQILNNLLSNAFKYTQSGEVALSVSAEYGDVANCVTLVCSVRDTGQGMNEEQLRKLFDEYTRFYLEANRDIEGIGLGMNITRQLVHLMHGEIFVKSAPGIGSTFTVRLPQGRSGDGKLGRKLAGSLQQFKNTPHMKTQQVVREPMPYGSVLIVDDLETNLYVSKGLMTPYGLSVDTALSGAEAIDKIRGGKEYDIVFMDHMMPNMDGVEAVKILRELGYTRSIVALTANAVAGQAEMFLENGFNEFLSKPIDLRQLNVLLNRLIRDVQPPNVIEAARRQEPVVVGDGVSRLSLDPQLAGIFRHDAERALATLEAMYANQYRRDDDRQMFVITVHAIKSALANIGETELSAFAYRLEQAGRAEDAQTLLADTPAFLDGLRALIEKITPQEEDGAETADEDPALLREQLSAIQAACAEYDRKAVTDALAELSTKAWSRCIGAQLDAIAMHLLHSEFEEVAGIAEEIGRTLSL